MVEVAMTNHQTPLETPQLAGRRNHETLYGSLARRNSLKNLIITALLVITGVAVTGMVLVSSHTRYLPYVIEVHEDGSVRKIGSLDPMWTPTDMMIRKEIRRFVQTIRGRFDDPKLTRDFWQDAGLHTRGKGRTLLMQTFTDAKLATFKGTVDVAIAHVLYLSGTSYNARWTETKRTEQRTVESVTHWSGIFTVSLQLPTTFSEVEANPQGIWIDPWTITEEQ